MSHLSNKDLLRVLDAVEVLNSGTGMDTLAERTLACMYSLIPNSTMTAFDGFDTEGDYDGSLWYSPPGTVPPERIQLLGELVNEHPNFAAIICTPDQGVFRLSDASPLSKFHKTTLFNEFYRLFQGDAQLSTAFRLSPRSLVTCSLHRHRSDFSDSEVETLRLVTPHLKAAFRNARDFERLENQKRHFLSAVTRGLVIIGIDGEILFINEIAIRQLEVWFEDGFSRCLPEVIQRYITVEGEKYRTSGYHPPPEPLTLRRSDRELTINLAFDNCTNELTLLLEERTGRSPGELLQMGLSTREAEILCWMSMGKTDREIGMLCGISHRTVEKHAENIYTKLGVENRLAAVMAAMKMEAAQ